MSTPLRFAALMVFSTLLVSAVGCGDDEADDLGVGAQCGGDADCLEGQTCLAFKGGYCGLQGCGSSDQCPVGSACVAHTDGVNYCFRICIDKAECNANRGLDFEANCSSNIDFVDGKKGSKACVPPS
jgi:hypothetical protein